MSWEAYHIQQLTDAPYTNSCIGKNILSLDALLDVLRHLPYQRISNNDQPHLVLTESRGTCSSKHAFVQLLAAEQGWSDVKLLLVMYKMKEDNTPGVGTVLQQENLEYLPEAHTVLEIAGQIVDITFPHSDFSKLSADVLEIVSISGSQAGIWKKDFHRQWLQSWLSNQRLPFSLDALWAIREKCIAALS